MEWIKPYTEEFHDRTIRGIERDIEYLQRHPEKIPEAIELGAASLGGGGRVAGRVAGAGVRGLIDLIGYIRALRRAGQAVEEIESESNLSTLHQRGLKPAPKTRQIPENIPRTWRIEPTRRDGGVWYSRPQSKYKGDAVRVMQGEPGSPYPNSRNPYVRWQRNGQALDAKGKNVAKDTPDAHIRIDDFEFKPELFK